MRAPPAPLLTLLLALTTVPVGSAGAEGSMCEMVARQLHAGLPAPASLAQLPGLFTPLGADLDAQKEADVLAELQQHGATPALLAQVKAQATCDTCQATLTWFSNHTAAIVRNEAGTMHCVTTSSLKAAGHQLDPVALPAAFTGDCPDTRLLSGQSDHQAYLADEATRTNSGSGPNQSITALVLSRWTGADWEQPCQVSVTVPMVFFELHLNCAEGVDCAALRRFAVADAAAAQTEQRTLSPEAQAERTRQVAVFASKYAATSAAPATDTTRFPDFTAQPKKMVFMGPDAGLDDIGLTRTMRAHPFAGGTLVSLVWEEAQSVPLAPKYPSWVVTQWLQAAGAIHPVAGFVVHQKPGAIATVSAGPAS